MCWKSILWTWELVRENQTACGVQCDICEIELGNYSNRNSRAELIFCVLHFVNLKPFSIAATDLEVSRLGLQIQNPIMFDVNITRDCVPTYRQSVNALDELHIASMSRRYGDPVLLLPVRDLAPCVC